MITEGILNINKPQNMTSHDIVGVVRRTLGIKKVGHTGTLDPMATGVLPICIGKSTRIIEYLDLDTKKYKCTALLGVATDTQDIWGTVLCEKSTHSITESMIRDAFKQFSGVIEQKPPIYSALKVNGKKLYEYAREGQAVEIKTRKIYIKDLEILDISLEGEPTVTFTVECSKGTYIRTICYDLGQSLGCMATLKSLERTKSGIFHIENALDLEELKVLDEEAISKKMYKSYEPLENFGRVTVDQQTGLMFINGWHLPLEKCNILAKPKYEEKDFYLPIRDEYRKAYNIFTDFNGEEVFLGVAFYNEKYKKLVADKVLYTRKVVV